MGGPDHLQCLIVGVTFFYHAPLEHHADPNVHTTAHDRAVVFPVDSGDAQIGRPNHHGRRPADSDLFIPGPHPLH